MNPLFDGALKNLEGLDPYLIWGAYTQFRGTTGIPSNGQILGNERLQFLIECTDTLAAPWCAHDHAYPFEAEHGAIAGHRVAAGQTQGYGIYSVSAPISEVFGLLNHLGSVIKRIELSTARKAPGDNWTESLTNDVKAPAASTAKNVLIIIDDGLAFLNQCFRRSGGNGPTSIAWFWDQTVENTVFPKGNSSAMSVASKTYSKAAPEWQPVYRFGYGRELDSRAINGLLKTINSATTERQVYKRLAYSRVQRDLAHGTHVAGWACAGHLEDTDIIMVQLPPAVSWDTSGGGTAKHVCDALIYALGRVAEDANLVVNLSFGASAGPHDGSTLLERAMDGLIKAQQQQRNIAMTLPAGNQFNSRCHAGITLEVGKFKELSWNIGKGDPTETFCELWYPHDDKVTVTLTTPLGDKIGPVLVGESRIDSVSNTTCAVIHRETSASGKGLSQVLLAVTPTQPLDAAFAAAPAGTWKIEIKNVGDKTVEVDAWIQRDDGILQGSYQSRQSYFSSTRVGLKNSEDDCATDPVKRAGTGNSIAHGEETIVVGGCFADNQLLSNYTAAKPVKLARAWPDILAPCDANPLLPGLLGQGTQSDVKARMNGTSISSPQVANRILAILKNPPKPRLTTDELRAVIVTACKKPVSASASTLDNLRAGSGCLS